MSTRDSTEFDPYYKWLGIPESEQPPNHYRLLGLELFEEDPEVITAAADRQMGHVKAFATGPYAAHSQLLLNELSKARVCLLNPNLKPIYDQQLVKVRSQRLKAISAAAADARPAAPTPQPTPNSEPLVSSKPSDSTMALETLVTAPSNSIRYKRRKKSSPIAIYVGTLVVSAAVLGGLLWYAQQTAPDVTKATAQSESPVTTTTIPNPSEVEEVEPEQTSPTKPVSRSVSPAFRRQEPAIQDSNLKQGNGFGQPNRDLVRTDPRPVFVPPFRPLPAIVSLADMDADQQIIGTFGSPIEDLDELALHLSAPAYLDRANRMVFLRPHHDTDEGVQWLVFDEPTNSAREIAAGRDPGDAKPIGMFRATENELRFSWLTDTVGEIQTDRLQLCVLRLVLGDQVHDMQLRKPIEDPEPIVLGDWGEIHEHQIPRDSIPNLPPPSELFLRVAANDGFPTTTVIDGEPGRLSEQEQLLLSFRGTDFAGLGAYWESKVRTISVKVSPGFRLVSYPSDLFVLSNSEVDKAEKRLEKDKRDATKDYNRRVRKRSVLNRNLTAANNMNIQIPGGGTTVALRNQKKAAIARARAEVNANEARIAALEKMSPLIRQDEQTRLPALRALASELNGRAKVTFELYLPVAGQEVVLYRKGMPTIESEDSETSADALRQEVSAPGFFPQ